MPLTCLHKDDLPLYDLPYVVVRKFPSTQCHVRVQAEMSTDTESLDVHLPGQPVFASPPSTAGSGTYVRDGLIRASLVGRVNSAVWPLPNLHNQRF